MLDWPQIGTTVDDFLTFEHELASEVEALPPLSQQHIPSISVSPEVAAIHDFVGLHLPGAPFSQVWGGSATGSQALGPSTEPQSEGIALNKPSVGPHFVPNSSASIPTVPLEQGTPPSEISQILASFLVSSTTYKIKDLCWRKNRQQLGMARRIGWWQL